MNPLTSISPLDGRYQKQLALLGDYFSESALFRYRVMVEVEYLIALSKLPPVKEIKKLSLKEQKLLRDLYEKFTIKDAQKIKEIEKTTNHDVKAVEYFIKEKMRHPPMNWGVHRGGTALEFIHFALTSEDVNNLAYSLMLKGAAQNVYIPLLEKLIAELKFLSKKYQKLAMLAFTHGQPATPTTLGKELLVYVYRLERQLNNLQNIKLLGKLNGATGNYAAHYIAYPDVNWPAFSKKFVESFGLAHNPVTTQIEPHDSLAEMYDNIRRINCIVMDLDQDMWLYISRKIFKLKAVKGEVGSSTMPHKVNPIHFENSEGNLGVANALWQFLSSKLPISKWQRDLTDSTVLRNQGSAAAYSVLAYQNTLKGLSRVEADKNAIKKELDEHPEVLAEAIQTILRKVGYKKPYEKMKELTRGQEVAMSGIKEFVDGLEIDQKEKDKLLNLTPQNYIGIAGRLR